MCIRDSYPLEEGGTDDHRIIARTVMLVLRRTGVSSGTSVTMEEFTGSR